jgi:DNA-binding CsgD family transcriptional regulator/small-conductance mechanosensitive channel
MLTVIDIIAPIFISLIAFVALLLIARFASEYLDQWAAKQTWPASTIIREAIRQPIIAFIIVVSASVGILSINQSWSWRGELIATLWTVFIILSVYSLLKIIQNIVEFFGKGWTLRNSVLIIRLILTILVVTAAALLVLGFWGIQTSPFLFVIAIISILIALLMRDVGPDYAAAWQIAMLEHVKVGESIKIPGGEEGKITKIGWHNVEVLTPEGRSIIIPNHLFRKMNITKIPSPSNVSEVPQNEKPPSSNETVNEISEPILDISTILSKREIEIALLISQGATNKELANNLGISENTVKVHMRNILQKLELTNRQQLAVLAAAQSKRIK